LREERRLRVLRRILGPNRYEVTGSGKNYRMRSFMFGLPTQYCMRKNVEKNKMGGTCSAFG
jgi:hypothetical protein